MRLGIVLLMISALIAGCSSVKTYTFKRDRVDQDMEGNRGYIKGTPPPAESRENLKREMIGVDVEIPILPWEEGEKVSIPPNASPERVEQPPVEEKKTILEIPTKGAPAEKTAIPTEETEQLK